MWTLLRPGAILLNGDHLADTSTPALTELALGLDRRTTARRDHHAEDWSDWWNAVRAEEALADEVGRRDARSFDHPEESETSLPVHQNALVAAGFAEVGVLWRSGTDAVMAGIR